MAHIVIHEVGPRDGLQMERQVVPMDTKEGWIRRAMESGMDIVQVGSFVHPVKVPQMADTDAFIRSLGKQESTVVSALILNNKGLERALTCGVPHVSMSVSVSDTHSRKNAGRPAAEALESMTQLIGQALDADMNVRAGLQCAFGCVYEGQISEKAVLSAAEKMAQAGAKEINLADTTGMATPYTVRNLIKKVNLEIPDVRISLHLHDTRGLGLANMLSGYEAGIRTFDVCTGGLGGCPFVRGAAGNVPTEDAVNMFETMGIKTGIDLQAICDAVAALEAAVGRKLPGRMKRVLEHKSSHE